jgi:multidrug efflux pump subunit AcrB
MPLREWLEIGSYLVTIVTLPFAVAVFLHQQRKERDNEDEEQYQHLSDAYNDFLRVVLDNARAA